MYNPIDGDTGLNSGSGFYYGFNLIKNPSESNIESNMPKYKGNENTLVNLFSKDEPVKDLYWFTASDEEKMMYVEIKPSAKMLEKKNIPFLYIENTPAKDLKKRSNENALPLGKSPVNLALYFDLTKFTKGEQEMSFRLFFENKNAPELLEQYKTLNQWELDLRRARIP
jgi:hypothetical protein